MRFQISLVIVILLCFSAKAQKNYAKELQSFKWREDSSSIKSSDKKIMILKKVNAKDEAQIKEETTFYPNGRLSRCVLMKTSSMVTETGEKLSLKYKSECDSLFSYEVKKDMIRIGDHGILYMYFKMKSIDNGLELRAIEPDVFYKKAK